MGNQAAMNMHGIASSGFQSIRDNGYQLICLDCCARHGAVPGLIGKERVIRMQLCEPCKVKGKKIPVDEYGFKKEKYDNGRNEEGTTGQG